jgi:hypothetical protein
MKFKLYEVEMDRIKVGSGFNLSLVVGCSSEGKWDGGTAML